MDLGNVLESMGFAPGDMSDTWKATMDGVHFSICIHPWRGIAIGFWHSSERTISEGEVFIRRDANKQEIAQALVQIHERIHGK
jgi:hypothetical protein